MPGTISALSVARADPPMNLTRVAPYCGVLAPALNQHQQLPSSPYLLRMAPSGAHEAPSTFITSLPAMIAVMPFALS